jgi:phosphoserine phosphatase
MKMGTQNGDLSGAKYQYVVTMFLLPPTVLEKNIAESLSQFRDMVCKIAGTSEISLSSSKTLESGEDRKVIEAMLGFNKHVPIEQLRKDPAIAQFEKTFRLQLCLQALIKERNSFSGTPRLAVFDMDSTLIQQEVIDEIAGKLGVEAQVSAITERAMNGELDFTESLRARCSLLKGVPSSVFEDLRSVITLSPGAADLVKALKMLGFKTAVLSGGFTPMALWQANQLGLDYAFANHLVVSEDGKTLTGELTGDIVNAEKKRELVTEIALKENIPLSHVLVVGDGANDLLMMGVAGLGVAFNAKPRVQEQAPVKLSSGSMTDILYLLGLSKEQREELLAGHGSGSV